MLILFFNKQAPLLKNIWSHTMKKLIILIAILNSTLLFSQKNIISPKQKYDIAKILGNDWVIKTYKNEIIFQTIKKVYFFNCVSLPVMKKNIMRFQIL
jgi:hypothetical protein